MVALHLKRLAAGCKYFNFERITDMSANVAFIGLSYHFGVTKSTDFIIKLLTQEFPSMVYFDHADTWLNIPRRKCWDIVIFWQYLPEIWEIEAIAAKSVILIPMFDSCSTEKAAWDKYKPYKIMAFSSTLSGLLQEWGHQVLYSQYFPPIPAETANWKNGLRGFFWPRRPDLTWEHILPHVSAAKWHSLHLHLTEPTVIPSAQAKAHFNIQTSTWFSQADEYKQILLSHNVFFSPRRYEGIGMAFLEAMALGMAVISPDNPTMNEYIISDYNGMLYDPDNSSPIVWDNAEKWGKQARQYAVEGRNKWERAVPDILNFFEPISNIVFLPKRHILHSMYHIFMAYTNFYFNSFIKVIKVFIKTNVIRPHRSI